MQQSAGALQGELADFFQLFGIQPPPGISPDGARRFMQAYLRDPARQARWDAHLKSRNAAAAPVRAAVVPIAPMRVPRGVAVPPAVSSGPVAGAESHAFEFTGSGAEYFRIWIVNLLLTLVTFGIYSAWAKVRRLQYFYRHTQLAGASFDYHGTGEAIFKGRLVALFLFLIYKTSFKASLFAGFLGVCILAVALPWLLRNAFRFRLRNSSYRGLRFRFTGAVGEAYRLFLIGPLAAVFSLYLAAPWFHRWLKKYQHGNGWFGGTPFAFSATTGQFYKAYALVALLIVGVFAGAGVVMGAAMPAFMAAVKAGGKPDPVALLSLMLSLFVLFTLASLLIAPLWQSRMQNLIWNHTTLGAHRFESRMRARELVMIHLTNFIGVLLTLGFFAPWAAVRVARYRAERLTLVVHGGLDDVMAAEEETVNAAGEETAELFDFDIGL